MWVDAADAIISHTMTACLFIVEMGVVGWESYVIKSNK